ncbi:MAG: phage portal protein [Atribacterota bacterium]|nr:phage portal protein [Atribacterota bacterium]
MPEAYNPMALFNKKKIQALESHVTGLKKQVKEISSYYSYPYQLISPIVRDPYTGEKTPGEMGAAKDYVLWYEYLRVRSWQSFLESEVTQAIIKKFALWVIGSGLKVQPEPVKTVLEQEGISNISPDFIKQVESRFNLWTASRFSDASKMFPVDLLAFETYKNAIIGGDVLVILYPEKGNISIQVIDGSHIVTPGMGSNFEGEAHARGNRIEYGIEISPNNEHVAYYVFGADGKYYRVLRYGEKSHRLMAFMVYGLRYRIDNIRGLPLISAVLETLRKLDRYKEATVGSAEERQKIAYSVEHNADSTGENPLLAKLQQARELGMGEAPESKSVSEYEAASTKVAATTNKQAFNMPIGATLKMLESKNELYFKDFYTANIELICAAVGIPYEVAMAMYNSNYSASRAAIKEWEHSMKTSRENFSSQFYQNFYNLWLEMSILTGKIQADGYIKAMNEDNIMAIEAYRNARWLGANVPHIDPVKEVQAERLKLGDDTTPLTTYDQASEALGSGDFSQNIEKIKIEKDLIEKSGLKPIPVEPKQPTKPNNLAILNQTTCPEY